jgi:hypothetical protein
VTDIHFDDLGAVRRFHDIAGKLRRYPAEAVTVDDYSDAKRLDSPESETLMAAGLLSSQVAGTDRHIVCIDVDHPLLALPSSTPGHWHLLIDVEMEWGVYEKLLLALAKARVIEPGYYTAAVHRHATFVRTPWTLKPGTPPSRSRERFRRWVGLLPDVLRKNEEEKKRLGRADAIERANDG